MFATAASSTRAAFGRQGSSAGTGAAFDRRVQAREFGLDVVELLQGLAAAGAEAFIQVGHHVVHGGGSLLAGPAVERLFAGGSPVGCVAGPASRRTHQLYELACGLSVFCITDTGRRHRYGRPARPLTHNAHEWTERYPAVVAAMYHLPVKSCLIDGEGRNGDQAGWLRVGRLLAAKARSLS